MAQFTDMGLEPEVQTVSPLNIYSIGSHATIGTADAQNILARLEGVDHSKAILITGHYDSVVSSPNASDGGSSVGVALEMARVLQASQPLKNDVIFLLTDAEEQFLLGAKGFVNEHPWMADVGLVLHFIARGSNGPSIMFETSPQNGWLLEEFAQSAPRPIANSMTDAVYQLLPNLTDFTLYKEAGAAGFNFGYIGRSAHYHTMLDNAENLDARSLQHHGSYALALTTHFGQLDLAEIQPQSDVIYFDIWGFTLIHYPTTWAIPLIIVVSLLFIGTVILGFVRKQLTFSGISKGSGFLLLALLVVVGIVFLLGQLAFALHDEYYRMFLGNLYNSTFYLGGFLFLTVAVTAAMYTLAYRRVRMPDLVVGGLSVWLILMWVTGLALPGASYMFVWPLLFSLLALGFAFYSQDKATASNTLPWAHLIGYLLGAIPGLVLLVPMARLMYAALPPLTGGWVSTGSWLLTGGVVVSIFFVLLLGLLIPHLFTVMRPKDWLLPVTMIIVSLGFLVGGSLTSGFTEKRPQPNSILYGLDTDTGDAAWLSKDERLDAWTEQFFPADAERIKPEEWATLGFGDLYFTGDAPVTPSPMPVPTVTLQQDEMKDGVRSLAFEVTLAEPARFLIAHVSVEPDTVTTVRFNGQDIPFRAEEDKILIQKWGHLPSVQPGFELYLETTSAQPVRVVVFGGFDGLPQTTELSFTPRSAHMMLAPMSLAAEAQNATVMRQSFEFPCDACAISSP